MRKMSIWLSNIDSSRSRIEGRKIAKGLAIKDPSLSEMTEAARKIGLDPEPSEAKYPKDQGKEEGTPGRIFMEKKYPKVKTMKLICDEIRRMRQST
jgi:signal recognition particle subunit SRP19